MPGELCQCVTLVDRDRIGTEGGLELFETGVRGAGVHIRPLHSWSTGGKVIAFESLVADLTGIEIVLVTVGQPPVVALGSEMLDVAVGDDLGARLE